MKKSFFIIACLTLATSAAFTINGSQSHLSSADSSQLIGQFCLSEKVEVTTPVIIPSSRVAFVESTGRTVYSKRADDPYFPVPDSLEHIDYNTYYYNPLVYYYFAMPNGYEEITEIFNLYNGIISDNSSDLEKFSFKVHLMCGLRLQSNGEYWNVISSGQPVYYLMSVGGAFPPYDMLEQMATLFLSYVVLMAQ